MNTRKLIPHTYLLEYRRLADLGVPIRKIIRDNDLDISGPHLTKLIDWCSNIYLAEDLVPLKAKNMIRSSLFPIWLQNEPKVQEQPDNHIYTGNFPHGLWGIKL